MILQELMRKINSCQPVTFYTVHQSTTFRKYHKLRFGQDLFNMYFNITGVFVLQHVLQLTYVLQHHWCICTSTCTSTYFCTYVLQHHWCICTSTCTSTYVLMYFNMTGVFVLHNVLQLTSILMYFKFTGVFASSTFYIVICI